ncbi:M28 family peptidase [Candidatus Thorarchaeota archaeon]|nr:MAG: M28 family peptidase [Candidatus Thorarchaeota archaeon]
MRRLWVCVFLGLMILVQPVYSEGVLSPVETTLPAAQDIVRRIYGENIADEIYEDLTTPQYTALVAKFTENGSRYIFDARSASLGVNYLSRLYLIQELEAASNGRIEVDVVGNHFNVVGRLPGYLPGDHPVIVVSAHYDSAELSPGANEDGSGIAVVLSLARMLSKYEWPLDIYFIAFNARNAFIPISGSPEVASYFQVLDIDILTMYNVDTILLPDPDGAFNEQIQIGYYDDGQIGYHTGQYWAEMTQMISNNHGAGVITAVPHTSFGLWGGSDHISFFNRGFSGITCLFESGSEADGSSSTPADMWTNADFDFFLGREATCAIGASIAFTMSRRYGSPTIIESDFSNGPGQFEMVQFVISTPTVVNITSRWFGGSSTFYLVDSDFNLIDVNAFPNASAWESTEIFNEQLTTKGLYFLFAENTHYGSVGYEVSITFDSDIDGNGILDKNEYWLPQSYFTSDQDDDGVSDAEEIFHGTDVNNVDSDGDTMDDRFEIEMGFNPTDPSDGNEDADNDGLTNAQEYSGGLNPFSKDTDNDKIDDLWELTYGLNPLVNDADLDLDGDSITNLEEYKAGTNPSVSDAVMNPLIWLALPVVVVIPVVGFLYIRTKNQELLA